jgi:hypothetical protein
MKQLNDNHRQQGDVLLKKITQIPATAKSRAADPKGLVLREGEHSNSHVVEQEDGVELFEDADKLYLLNNTESDVIIKHQEHKPITVPPGIYEIGAVQEHDYFEKAARAVRD